MGLEFDGQIQGLGKRVKAADNRKIISFSVFIYLSTRDMFKGENATFQCIWVLLTCSALCLLNRQKFFVG